MATVISVGHVTHDRYGDAIVAGGCAYFGARVQHALGARVRLVTTVGEDFACADAFDGLEVQVRRAGKTTLFNLVAGDFPPSADPYYVQDDNQMLFVVNTGAELLVIEPRFTSSNGLWNTDVKWVPTNGRFEDPSSGAKFTLTGEWYHNNYLNGTIDSRGLGHYPVEVRGDALWLTALTPLPGRLVATAGPAE